MYVMSHIVQFVLNFHNNLCVHSRVINSAIVLCSGRTLRCDCVNMVQNTTVIEAT